VQAGAQDLPGISINHYGPAEVRIPQGGTVTWRNPNIEPHTVSFGMPRVLGPGTPPISPADIARIEGLLEPNPQSNVSYTSGQLNSGIEMNGTFSVTFPNAGTYNYLCVIHPGMDGTVVVVPSGQTVPAQAELDTKAQQEFQPLLTAARAERDRQRSAPVRSETRPDGTTLFRVLSGREIPKTDVNLFFPESVTLRQGDTVTWESPGFTPHTITFGELPAGPAGPPPVEFFTGFRPTGPFTGGFAHSGFVGNNMPAGQTYSLTFGTTGTFNYVCILHAEQGMIGRVTVNARAGAPAPTGPTLPPAVAQPGVGAPPVVQLPRTGSGLDAGLGNTALGIGVLVSVLAIGGGFALRMRRAPRQ
jgi:plastocyanin